MITGASQMRCGGCGESLHRVFTTERHVNIILECTKCKSQSVIGVSTPRLSIDWGDDNQLGQITVFPRDDKSGV